jgi:chromosome segregation ATPase
MSHQAALDALGKMTRILKAFEDTELVLRTLAGVEQNERELRAAVERARAELAVLAEQTETAKTEAKAARLDARKVQDATKGTVQRMLDEANTNAAAIRQEADTAVEDARAALAAIRAETEKAIADSVAAKAQLADVEAKIDKARQQIAKLLG